MNFSNILKKPELADLDLSINLFSSIIDKSTPFLETLKTSSPLNFSKQFVNLPSFFKC